MVDGDPRFSSLMEITTRPPLVFVEGVGSWLWDESGEKYLDFIQGWAVNCLGHAPPVLTAALTGQAQRLLSPSPAFRNQPALELADRLTRKSCFDRVFFANSGAEANEGAFKLVRKWGAQRRGGAHEIVTMTDGFHGRTLAAMSASGKPQGRELFEPKVPGFPKVPLNDLAAAEAAIGERTAAVMLEPIQGEAGVIMADDDYLRGLRRLTREKNVLLVLDEIQTGMGRTGSLFAHEHAGVEPDVMTLGKGLGGGVPLAALLAKEDVCRFEPDDQGGAYSGNPLMTAAGRAVFDELTRPGFLEEVARSGLYLRRGLDALSERLGLGETRGRGLLLALELGRDVGAAVVEEARRRKLLLNSPRPACLRFMPALNVTREEIDFMLEILESVLRDALGRAARPA